MAKKTKNEKPLTGEELYESTKLTWRLYLEAALTALHRAGIDPTQASREFREMCIQQAVKELGYE